MRNKRIAFLLAPLAFSSLFLLSGCNSDTNDKLVLKILNSEDYIYLYEDGDEECFDEECSNQYAYQMDMVDQFKLIYEKNHPGVELEVIYDTYDTNETMFNELQTGKTTYDVIITSDYMVQKLASKDMLYKFPNDEINNYWDNIAPYIFSRLEPINIFTNKEELVGNLTQYCVPYMWGTIGIMYNPDFYINKAPQFYIDRLGEDYDENLDLYEQALPLVQEDFSTWDVLYRTDEGNPYSKSFSIKDSVRDAYTIAAIHCSENKEKIREIVEKYGVDEAPEFIGDLINIPSDKLNDTEYIQNVMNIVMNDLEEMKANAFGFETDSGKTDMTTQKIGANLCWSGDATWAMTEAEEFDLELYFTMPLGTDFTNWSASNLWFDCFAMPKNHKGDVISEKEQNQYDLTEEFIRFMGEPINAVQNSYCVGYTPATNGEEVLDYMLSMYDSTYMIESMQEELNNLDEDSFDTLEDFLEYKEELETALEEEQEYYDECKNDPNSYYDISYIFDDEEGKDIFVPYSYYLGRQLPAQYPDISELNRLAIMKDFGDKGTQALLDMWETVRTNPLPTWAIITFVVEGVALVAFGLYFVNKKVVRKKLKKSRI